MKSKRHKSPMQDKSKKKHSKTHTNQTNKDWTQRKNIKSSKGEATSNIQRKPHRLNSWSFSRNSAGQKGMARYILSTEREKSTTKITIHGKGHIQNSCRNRKLSRQAKVKRIQSHQPIFITNVKGTYIVKKYKRRKNIYKLNAKQLKKELYI